MAPVALDRGWSAGLVDDSGSNTDGSFWTTDEIDALQDAIDTALSQLPGNGASLTAHGVLIGNGTGAPNATSAGTAGRPLVSGGASADPTFTALKPGGGGVGNVPIALTDGATVAVDASLGTVFDLVAAGDRTILAPTNLIDGQKFVIRHKASGGARTLTLTTGSAGAFAFGFDITSISQTSSGKTDIIGCIYSAADARCHVVAFVKGF